MSSSSSASSTSHDSDSDHVTSKPPSKRGKSSSSSRGNARLYSIFQEHFDDLRSVIQCPESMASKLFSKKLISSDVVEEISTSQQSAAKKAFLLLVKLRCLLERDSGKLLVLLDVLKQDATFDGITSKISGKRVANYCFL